MTLAMIFADLADYSRSNESLHTARCGAHPLAFTQCRNSTGCVCVRNFLRAELDDQVVTLRAADQHDARDHECLRQTHAVRLVRTVAGNGSVYVLMTNLLDTARFPVAGFGAL